MDVATRDGRGRARLRGIKTPASGAPCGVNAHRTASIDLRSGSAPQGAWADRQARTRRHEVDPTPDHRQPRVRSDHRKSSLSIHSRPLLPMVCVILCPWSAGCEKAAALRQESSGDLFFMISAFRSERRQRLPSAPPCFAHIRSTKNRMKAFWRAGWCRLLLCVAWMESSSVGTFAMMRSSAPLLTSSRTI